MLYFEPFLGIASHACGSRQEGHAVVKSLLQYSLTLLEKERYEVEVQPYRKTDYKPMIFISLYDVYDDVLFRSLRVERVREG